MFFFLDTAYNTYDTLAFQTEKKYQYKQRDLCKEKTHAAHLCDMFFEKGGLVRKSKKVIVILSTKLFHKM